MSSGGDAWYQRGTVSFGRTLFPPQGEWRKQEPAAAGLDKAKLDEAIAFAIAHENSETKDLAIAIPNQFRNEAPYNALIGPTQPRTGSNGLIVRRGSVVGEWGETGRADMTFSVTKTFLSTVVGLAFDRGQIRMLRIASRATCREAWISSPRPTMLQSPGNISCARRATGPARSGASRTGPTARAGIRLPRNGNSGNYTSREPSTSTTIRINVLALAALYVLKRPLLEVLDEAIMTPIAASSSWRWEAYDNAWVEIDGRRMKSVTGGGHFGGGMFINAYDMARFGYLFLHNGQWEGRQLISRKWIEMARSPGPANDGYGFCNWYLNNPSRAPDGTVGPLPFPSAPRSSITFQGNGVNVIYLDWDHDLLIVARWIDTNRNLDQFIGKVIAAIKP